MLPENLFDNSIIPYNILQIPLIPFRFENESTSRDHLPTLREYFKHLEYEKQTNGNNGFYIIEN